VLHQTFLLSKRYLYKFYFKNYRNKEVNESSNVFYETKNYDTNNFKERDAKRIKYPYAQDSMGKILDLGNKHKEQVSFLLKIIYL